MAKGNSHSQLDGSEVLVIQLGCESEAQAVERRHGEFLRRIKETLGLTVVTTASEAIEFINSQHPPFILVVDSEFANPNHRRLQNEVAYIVENGAAFVMCGEFPRNVDSENFRAMALNAFNLGWEPGDIHRGVYQLHKPCDVLEGIHRAKGVEIEVEITAALVHNVDDPSRLYICKDLDDSQAKDSRRCAAVAFERRGFGYFGWVGDINGIGEIHNVVFKFIDGAGPRLRAGRLSRLRRGRNLPQASGGRRADQLRAKEIRSNRAPTHHRNPCDNCGKGFTSQVCFECKAVYYCSLSCKNASSHKHREVCAAHRASLSQAIEMANQGSPMPLVRELIISPKDHQEVLERLIDCYRFRVEDLHKVSGIETGCYRDPGPNDVHMEEFINFLRQLQRSNQPVRPPWWDFVSQTQCEDMARNHIMRYYIGNPIDENEVVAHYDETLMPAALRALGDILYGRPVPQRPEQDQKPDLEAVPGPDKADDRWEQASSNDSEDLDQALEGLKLENPVRSVAVIETKSSSEVAAQTQASLAPPASQISQATATKNTANPPVPPRQQPRPKKREPIVHVWEPPNPA